MEATKCNLVSFVTVGCILVLLPCMAKAQQTYKPPAVFIFGDSLSDPGNNNYIRTLSRANNPPNGIDFPGGYPTGRYSNGRTTVDIIGKLRCS